MYDIMDIESNDRVIEIELTDNITNIENLNDFIHQIIRSITENITTGENNEASFTIEYEIINNNTSLENNNNNNISNKKITNKDILKQLGSYKRINIDDDLIKCKSSCPICLDNYKDKEYKRTLKCGHTFHKKCIDKWIKKHNSCPICRKCCLDI